MLLGRGDIESAAHLYDRHASILLALALRILRVRSEAEDVIHDAFVTLRDRAAHYAPGRGSPLAWLVTLVRNLSIDRLRRRERDSLLHRRAAAEDVAQGTLDPETLLSRATAHAGVRRVLASLPGIQRATLELAFFEELTYAEIASRERLPLGTIKSRAARGLASLRLALEVENIRVHG